MNWLRQDDGEENRTNEVPDVPTLFSISNLSVRMVTYPVHGVSVTTASRALSTSEVLTVFPRTPRCLGTIEGYLTGQRDRGSLSTDHEATKSRMFHS